jgi:hypothetical protein
VLLGAAVVFAALGCDRGAPPPTATTNEAEQPQRLPTATLRVGDIALVVEVAKGRDEQAKGMMFRRRLGPDEAMFFVFDRQTNLAFWMKNTSVDLDLAYVAADGRIVQTERMKAFDTSLVYSREPARFALEVPAGWLEAHGIEVGAQVTIPPEVAAPAPEP